MFYIVIVTCLVSDPDVCKQFSSDPEFESRAACAKYVASDEFKRDDVRRVVQTAALRTGKFELWNWEAACTEHKNEQPV